MTEPAPACSWRTLRQPHGPHDWWPQDSVATVHCDGYAADADGPSVQEAAADDRKWFDYEKAGE